MAPEFVLAALASALLHALWNAAVKAGPDPDTRMLAQMVAGAVFVLPALFWIGLPDPVAWPWLAASTVLNACTVLAILRAYERGGFGIVYASVRALSVVLVVPLAALLADEVPARLELAGVLLIAMSLTLLALGDRVPAMRRHVEHGRGPAFRASVDLKGVPSMTRSTLLWILLAGMTAAGYAICDARAVRADGAALPYALTVSVANAVFMALLRARRIPLWRIEAREWGIALPVALAALASYALLLWAVTTAPVAPTMALRDTSAFFGLIIGLVWFGERLTGPRVIALLIAAGGVLCVRFGW